MVSTFLFLAFNVERVYKSPMKAKPNSVHFLARLTLPNPNLPVIVSATGFNFQKAYPMNHIKTTIDGVPYNSGDTMFYKSVMLSDVPNLFFSEFSVAVFGNAI
jgi:cation diffusion facilitator CzcD-associated flavoprotein CzcO